MTPQDAERVVTGCTPSEHHLLSTHIHFSSLISFVHTAQHGAFSCPHGYIYYTPSISPHSGHVGRAEFSFVSTAHAHKIIDLGLGISRGVSLGWSRDDRDMGLIQRGKTDMEDIRSRKVITSRLMRVSNWVMYQAELCLPLG